MHPSKLYNGQNGIESTLQNLNFFSNLLEDGYDLRLKVTGRSMSPFLRTGTFVTLSKEPLSKLCIGDIIFCQCNDGSFKLHRLIQAKDDLLITRGDALVSIDVPFRKKDYVDRQHKRYQPSSQREQNFRSSRIPRKSFFGEQRTTGWKIH